MASSARNRLEALVDLLPDVYQEPPIEPVRMDSCWIDSRSPGHIYCDEKRYLRKAKRKKKQKLNRQRRLWRGPHPVTHMRERQYAVPRKALVFGYRCLGILFDKTKALTQIIPRLKALGFLESRGGEFRNNGNTRRYFKFWECEDPWQCVLTIYSK